MKMTLNEESELLRNGKWFDKIVGTLPNDEYLNLGWAIGDVLDTLESLRMLQPKAETNADRIRAMSDEELADIFLRADFCKCCEHNKDGVCNYICAYPNIPLYDGCIQAALTWMKQPAEEET